MKKSFTTTLMLVAVFALLLGWYFIVEQRIRPENEKAEADAKRIVQLDSKDIQFLEIETPKPAKIVETGKKEDNSPTTIKLKRSGEDWFIVSPIEDSAENSTVKTLLSSLTSAKTERTVTENAEDLAPFGLDQPAIKVAVQKDSQSPRQEIWIGKETPVGSNLYIKFADSKEVMLASQSLKRALEKDLFELRNKKLISLARGDISEVEVSGDRKMLVKKGDDSNWKLARLGAPVDSAPWTQALNSIMDLKAENIVEENREGLLGKYGLTNPAFTVTLRTADATKDAQVLNLSKKGDKYYGFVADKPFLYEVKSKAFEQLSQKTETFFDMHIAKFNRFKVTELKFETTPPIHFKKTGSDWGVPDEPRLVVDSAKIDEFLGQLQDVKATELFLKQKAEKPKKPEFTLQILWDDSNGKESPKPLTLTFEGVSKKFVKGFSTSLDFPFEISQKDFQKLKVKKADYLKADSAVEKDKKSADKKG